MLCQYWFIETKTTIFPEDKLEEKMQAYVFSIRLHEGRVHGEASF